VSQPELRRAQDHACQFACSNAGRGFNAAFCLFGGLGFCNRNRDCYETLILQPARRNDQVPISSGPARLRRARGLWRLM
jgi:hypothetical protein